MLDLSSLTVRLSLSLSLVAFVVAGAIVGVLLFKLAAQQDTLQDRSLEWQAKDIAVHLHLSSPGGELTFDLPAELAQAYDQPSGQYLFLISDQSGTWEASMDYSRKFQGTRLLISHSSLFIIQALLQQADWLSQRSTMWGIPKFRY